MRAYVSFLYSTSRWSVRRNLVYDNQNILRWHTHQTYNSIFPLAMRLLHHTKSKVALLVCLFLLVVTAAPAPPSPSVDLAVPPPVYSPGSSAKPTVTFVHPLDTGQQKAPGATVVAGIVIYAPKSLTPGLILAAKTLLKPAIPAIMSHLRKSKGLDYTITDDFEVSVTKDEITTGKYGT
ncbi:hypothetical protein F5880DRAFT_1600531 [Lentinula raphanica]|nr:hypothetical protein F5880DRAFT_1600531 [Lentinula raphanica]